MRFNATEAAGQFALSEEGRSFIERTCGAKVAELPGFELILETKSVAGTPLKQTVVASRCGGK